MSNEQGTAPRRTIQLRVLLILIVVVAIASFYAAGLHREFDWPVLKARVDSLRTAVDEHFVVTLAVFVLTYVAAVALSLPVGAGLSLIAGALFGRWVGTAAVSVASTTGATLAFLGTRFLFRDLVERRFGARLRPIQDGIERDGAYYLLTLRLVPLFPFFLVNLAMGLTRIRPLTFVWVSWLGMLPATFLYVNAGTEISTIESPSGILSTEVIISLALLGLIPLLIRFAVRRLSGGSHFDRQR
jgi:uncharacterized membrane protein YdjX (TVP38/TMEM64 family)